MRASISAASFLLANKFSHILKTARVFQPCLTWNTQLFRIHSQSGIKFSYLIVESDDLSVAWHYFCTLCLFACYLYIIFGVTLCTLISSAQVTFSPDTEDNENKDHSMLSTSSLTRLKQVCLIHFSIVIYWYLKIRVWATQRNHFL